MAYDALVKSGYENVKIEKIAGMGHESRAPLAAGWFGAYLTANRKMFLAGDKADELLEGVKEHIAKEKWRDAVKDLRRGFEKHEERNGLAPISGESRDKLTQVAVKLIDEAKKAYAAADNGEALKLIGKVTRDFKGLAPYEEDRELEKQWKEPPAK